MSEFGSDNEDMSLSQDAFRNLQPLVLSLSVAGVVEQGPVPERIRVAEEDIGQAVVHIDLEIIDTFQITYSFTGSYKSDILRVMK